MKLRLVLLVLVLAAVVLVSCSCSLSASGRQGGQNNSSIQVTTCPDAKVVGQGSCGASVIWLGGGN